MTRRIIAALLVVVACLLAPFAVGARWVKDTITDGDHFAATIAPLADDPLVQQAVAATATTAITSRMDVAGRLDRFPLPDEVRDSIAAGVESAVSSRVEQYVRSEQFGTVWAALARQVQEQLVGLIDRDGSGAVALRDGAIVLDTTQVATLIREQLADSDIPGLSSVDLSQLGADVPAQVVLVESPNLQIAADALRIFMPVASWLWVVVLAMLVVGVLLWPRRSRGLMWAGLGLAVGGGLTWLALDVGTAQPGRATDDPMIGYLVTDVIRVLVRWLVNSLLVMVAVGIACLVLGFLGGGLRSGQRINARITRSADGWGSAFADSPIVGWIARAPSVIPALRGLVLVGALLVLLVMDVVTPSTVVWTLVSALLLLLAVEVLAGGVRVRQQPVGVGAEAPWYASGPPGL